MTILFMCAANSVRSQLAEGLARKYLTGVQVMSAGASSSHVNPMVLEVLEEMEGIDAGDHMSKSVYEVDMEKVDMTIAVCKEGVIPPELLRKPHQVWPFSVPTGKSGYQELVLKMKQRIFDLKSQIQMSTDQ